MSISQISRHYTTALLLGEHEGNLVVEALSDRAERPMLTAPKRQSAYRHRFLRADLGSARLSPQLILFLSTDSAALSRAWRAACALG